MDNDTQDILDTKVAEQHVDGYLKSLNIPDSFDVFEDRTKSLLDRWRVYRDRNRDIEDISVLCIKGFLQEVKDKFTESLMNGR